MLWQVGALHRSPRLPRWGDVPCPQPGRYPQLRAPSRGRIPFSKISVPLPPCLGGVPNSAPVPGRLSRPHPPRRRLKSQLCGTRMMMLLPPVSCSGCYRGRPAADPGIPLLIFQVVEHVMRNVALPRARQRTGHRRGGQLPLTGGAPVWPCTWQAANKQHPLCVEFGRAPVSEGPCGRA